MNLPTLALVASMLLASSTPGFAQGYPLRELLSGSRTVVGEEIAYPEGTPVVTAAIVTLAPGEHTIVHRHGAPMLAFMLEGELTVDYGNLGTKTYTAGQSFLEAMHVDHAGTNTGTGPARVLSVYIGASGVPNVVPTP